MSEIKKEKEEGVTLIELMIVLVIAAILVAGIYSLFITQQRSYTVQDQVAGAQQDARAALTLMARDIRMAGFLLGSEGFNVNGAQFAVTPNNNAGGTDSITVAYAADAFISGGIPVTVTSVSGTSVTLSAIAESSFFDSAPGENSFVAFEGVDQVYQISSGIGTQTLTLTASPPTYIANVGAKVFRAKSITYFVQNNALERNENGIDTQPIAGDGISTIVEDLQFAYQVRGVNYWTFDGVLDAGETSDTALPASTTNADIRMVRINIILRTAVPDPEETSFFKPACEDRGQINTDS
ncbi:MAG TPA: prepilin-type N-terminal cleavage/methylation domain-containing protein, partial [Dehalococcoidia bacterium]|nr:prepilin-type N-terminal cleavage/methylation domain-containing protein [Dehalococcoidia bacterium]